MTGVQTCALPIYISAEKPALRAFLAQWFQGDGEARYAEIGENGQDTPVRVTIVPLVERFGRPDDSVAVTLRDTETRRTSEGAGAG